MNEWSYLTVHLEPNDMKSFAEKKNLTTCIYQTCANPKNSPGKMHPMEPAILLCFVPVGLQNVDIDPFWTFWPYFVP